MWLLSSVKDVNLYVFIKKRNKTKDIESEEILKKTLMEIFPKEIISERCYENTKVKRFSHCVSGLSQVQSPKG